MGSGACPVPGEDVLNNDFPTILRQSSEALATEKNLPVRFDAGALSVYLLALRERHEVPSLDSELLPSIRESDRSAFVLIRDCINFGSGFHPFLEKRANMSGSRTIAWNLASYFRLNGAPTPDELSAITTDRCAHILNQNAPGAARDLIEMFVQALNEFGTYILNNFNGTYNTLIDHAGDSAIRFVESLVKMSCWNDRVQCMGLDFPFYKRAQLTAYGISQVRPHIFSDIARLTAFADNLIPHVLKVDRVLQFNEALDRKIAAGTLLDVHSLDEVSIRAMTVNACDVLARLCLESGVEITSLELASFLWKRGQSTRYKSAPRPRTRTFAY